MPHRSPQTRRKLEFRFALALSAVSAPELSGRPRIDIAGVNLMATHPPSPGSGTGLNSNRLNVRGAFRCRNNSTLTLGAMIASRRYSLEVDSSAAGIESPFLRTLAPGARLLLSHSDSMPSLPFRSAAPVFHQNSAPVHAGMDKTDCAAVAARNLSAANPIGLRRRFANPLICVPFPATGGCVIPLAPGSRIRRPRNATPFRRRNRV